MDRGWLSLLERAGLALGLAVLILVVAVGYGVYSNHQAPAAEPAAAVPTAPAAQ